jgi:chemotaxis response regulator CheB
MKVLICDDDPLVRSVLSSLLVDEHHDVVAEVEDSADAIDMIEAHQPDVAIIDLSLAHSSGHEIEVVATARGCKTIIFSAFVSPETRAASNGSLIVEKPDFDGLIDALRRIAYSHGTGTVEQRAQRRHAPQAREFFEAVAEAASGDALVLLQPPAPDPGHVAILLAAAQRVVASSDRVSAAASGLRMLLAGADEAGVAAVLARVEHEAGSALDGWNVRSVIIGDGESPSDAFLRLTEPPNQTP